MQFCTADRLADRIYANRGDDGGGLGPGPGPPSSRCVPSCTRDWNRAFGRSPAHPSAGLHAYRPHYAAGTVVAALRANRPSDRARTTVHSPTYYRTAWWVAANERVFVLGIPPDVAKSLRTDSTVDRRYTRPAVAISADTHTHTGGAPSTGGTHVQQLRFQRTHIHTRAAPSLSSEIWYETVERTNHPLGQNPRADTPRLNFPGRNPLVLAR